MLLGAAVVLGGWALRPQRFSPYKWPLLFLGFAWFANFVPFALITRPMFLYHYFFALIFSIGFVAVGLGALLGWHEERTRTFSFSSRASGGLYWGLLAGALLVFLYFAPISYGIPITTEASITACGSPPGGRPMAVFTLLSALALGAAIVRLIPFDLYRFEAAALSVVLGLFTSSWLSLILSLLLPFDLALPLLLFITIVAAVVLWQRGRANAWRPLEGGKRAWYAWGAATLVTFPILARLFWTHSLLRDQDGVWSAGASWADYGVHAAIISHIAVSPKFPTDLSIAAGEKLTYPFLIDLLSAMYVQAGWSIHTSLFWPGCCSCWRSASSSSRSGCDSSVASRSGSARSA